MSRRSAIVALVVLLTSTALVAGVPATVSAQPRQVEQVQSRPTVVIIGDSVSRMLRDSPSDQVVRQRLDADVRNMGVDGSRAFDYVHDLCGCHEPGWGIKVPDPEAFMAEVDAANPRLIFVMLGSNEWLVSNSLATYRARLSELLARLRALEPAARLVVGHAHRLFLPRPHSADWSLFGSTARHVAVQFGAGYVDLEPAFPGTRAQDTYGWVDPDDAHLTYAGNAYLAALLGTRLRPYLWWKPPLPAVRRVSSPVR